MNILKVTDCNKQAGNVLFLILIAVALFATLSYAVTQSSRGGGDADNEVRAVDTAAYTQIVSTVRSSLQRMMISKGLSVDDINLCATSPSQCFTTGFNTICSTGDDCLFAPEGGGVSPTIFTDDYSFSFIQPGNAAIAGHGAINIIMTISGSVEEEFCSAMQERYGLSSTLEVEQTANVVFADGIASLEGQWDFCYDVGGQNYRPVHLLATN